MSDLVKSPADLTAFLKDRIREKNRQLKAQGLKPVSPKRVIEDVMIARKRLMRMIVDTRPVLWDAADSKQRILCEGAQGSLLDIDHGTSIDTE